MTIQKTLIILCIALLSLSSFASATNYSIGFASATTYHIYTIYGPVVQGSPLLDFANNPTIQVNMFNANNTGALYTVYLNPSGTTSQEILSSVPIEWISWNASSVLNYTATIFPDPKDLTPNYKLFVVAQGVPTYLYTFPIADFVGMTHAYISDYNSAGVLEEQFSLGNINPPAFLMQQFQSYSLKITCDQGTYTQSFVAGNTLTTNLQILAGIFAETNSTTLIASATRNNTFVTINYFDPSSNTTALTITVTHLVGTTVINDFSDTGTNSYNAILTVDATTDYTVTITAQDNTGLVTTWKFTLPVSTTPVNPFTGLFSFLGNWPPGLDPAQLLAAFIIMCALSVGSFKTTGFSCVLAWIITGILMVMGWYTMGIPLFAFAGVLSIFIVIQEAKQGQGE